MDAYEKAQKEEEAKRAEIQRLEREYESRCANDRPSKMDRFKARMAKTASLQAQTAKPEEIGDDEGESSL